jgi:hypothetical protein
MLQSTKDLNKNFSEGMSLKEGLKSLSAWLHAKRMTITTAVKSLFM